jgi:hypothetical protein
MNVMYSSLLEKVSFFVGQWGMFLLVYGFINISFRLWKTQHILKYCMLSFQVSIRLDQETANFAIIPNICKQHANKIFFTNNETILRWRVRCYSWCGCSCENHEERRGLAH